MKLSDARYVPVHQITVLELAVEMYGTEMLKMAGYDDCILGVVTRCGQVPILCYSRQKVIANLMEQGMSENQAEEYFAFNQEGTWMGEHTRNTSIMAVQTTMAQYHPEEG